LNTYVALLRGINVGGKTIKMDALKSAFISLGFQNSKTLLASGNVIFDSEETNEKQLTKLIEEKLQNTFGFEIIIVLRTIDYIRALIDRDPFIKINPSPDLRLYVSFLAEQTRKSIEIPYESPQKDFRIISMTDGELFSVLEVNGKTTDAMNMIEKKFGKKVTTRNWNTVKKIGAA
jgi:uncharacterized protein (DUF1697 family)